jgi:hypothetical protein
LRRFLPGGSAVIDEMPCGGYNRRIEIIIIMPTEATATVGKVPHALGLIFLTMVR